MEWVVETVLPREVRKLASVIEEKDNQIQAHQHKILKLNEEIGLLIKNRHVPRRGYFDNVSCFIKKNSKETHPYYVIRCQYRQLEKYKKLLKLRYPDIEETGRWMIQMLFIDGTYSRVKWSRNQTITKIILAWQKRSKNFLKPSLMLLFCAKKYQVSSVNQFCSLYHRLQNIMIRLYNI